MAGEEQEERLGSIRLRLEAKGIMISNFRPAGELDWGEDTYAHKAPPEGLAAEDCLMVAMKARVAYLERALQQRDHDYESLGPPGAAADFEVRGLPRGRDSGTYNLKRANNINL